MRLNGPCTIGDDVRAGRGVVVWQYASILGGTTIGDGAVIGSCCWIGRNCQLGSNVHLNHGCFVPHGTVIEDDVFLGPGVVLTDDKLPRSGNKDYRAEPPILRRGCSIGAGAIILPGIEIGAGAVVAAGAVVTRNVPPGLTVIGMPARDQPRRASRHV